MKRVFSVSEINRYIKDLFSRDLILNSIWIRGEISNFKLHYTGHMYFTLKDENCTLKCVMFKGNGAYLKFQPESGTKVLIRGSISVFERDGQYQLYAEEMQPDGLGALHLAFEQLKKKLQAEGLFDETRKKKIPYIPRCIGVVTSPTGSVVKDIIKVTGRRCPGIELKIFSAAVQGEDAPRQIVAAIEAINRMECSDVIIIARGGGSLEELWAFNEEIVARSIAASKIPVISAVGHETDFTIADFVADLRAPTPSAAAELVVPDRHALMDRINGIQGRLKMSLVRQLEIKRSKLDRLVESRVFKQPYDKINQERMKIDLFGKTLLNGMNNEYAKSRKRLEITAGKLDSLSPLAVLSRGYAVVKSADKDTYIQSVKDVKADENLDIRFKDGIIRAKAK